MEVEVGKENVCINKLVCEKKEVIFVQEDLIVPDSKPDILNTINATGNLCIVKKEALDEKVKIDGNINTYIMYLPDSKEDNIRGLVANFDFSENIQVQGSKQGMNVESRVCIKDIECKVLNGRKINVKVALEIVVKVYSNEEIDIINRITNVEDIQTLEENFNINSLVGMGNTTVYAKETIQLEETGELAEILKTEVNLVDSDIKISYNKVLAKSEAEVRIMYLTENNQIKKVTAKIPIVGFIDIANVAEDNICDTNYDIKNILINPNSAEEHSINAELEVGVTCMAYEKKQLNLIQDLYSPTMNLSFEQKRISTVVSKTNKQKEYSVKEKINLGNVQESDILDIEAVPVINKEQITNSKIIYSGEISIKVMFNSGSVSSKIAKVPFEFSIDNPEGTELINCQTQAMVSDKSFNITSGGEIECNIGISFNTSISRNANINIIDNIEENQKENRADDYDSLIIYVIQPNDTLWKIAKRFGSTVEDIAITNGIENKDKINVGQKLYIPKFKVVKRDRQDEKQAIYM